MINVALHITGRRCGEDFDFLRVPWGIVENSEQINTTSFLDRLSSPEYKELYFSPPSLLWNAFCHISLPWPLGASWENPIAFWSLNSNLILMNTLKQSSITQLCPTPSENTVGLGNEKGKEPSLLSFSFLLFHLASPSRLQQWERGLKRKKDVLLCLGGTPLLTTGPLSLFFSFILLG